MFEPRTPPRRGLPEYIDDEFAVSVSDDGDLHLPGALPTHDPEGELSVELPPDYSDPGMMPDQFTDPDPDQPL